MAELFWTVDGFSHLAKEGVCVESPVFYGGVRDGVHADWRLKLYPVGDKGVKGHISLYLYLSRCNYSSIAAKFKMWLTNQSNQISLIQDCDEKKEFDTVKLQKWGWAEFSSMAHLSNARLIEGDKLRIHCEVHSTEITGTPLDIIIPTNNSAFVNRYWPMYEQQKHTDASIVVGNNTFRVHKIVLAAQSKVFDRIFEAEDTKQNQVDISDFDAQTVEKLIKFVYTGECGDLGESAAEVLACADKYDVKELKSESEIALLSNLNPQNAPTILQLADSHKADLLKRYTLNFIKGNLQAVMAAKDWKSLSRPLIDEVMIELSDAIESLKTSCSLLPEP